MAVTTFGPGAEDGEPARQFRTRDACQDPRLPFDDGHADTARTGDGRDLHADVTAADYREMPAGGEGGTQHSGVGERAQREHTLGFGTRNR